MPSRYDCLMSVKLSILDLAPVGSSQSTSDSFRASVALAQQAERFGYTRVWYAEHHNMSTIASSATSVVIAHVGAQTETIRLGSGGIMLPNHSPLVIAEQFGTLAAMYPDRIDLGLGRAPGSDQNTARALRLTGARAESFPNDVRELQGYLSGHSLVPGVDAFPGKGSNVAALHPRFLAVRCPTGGRPSVSPTPSPPTSPPEPSTRRSPSTARSSSPPSSSRRRT